MKKKFRLLLLNLIFIIIFSFSHAYSHERFAQSNCNIFLNKIIDNYESIKDHYYLGGTPEYYGFTLEKTWDPNIIHKGKDGKESYGDVVLRRDKSGNIFILNVFPNSVKHVNFRPGDKIVKINNSKVRNYSEDEINELLDNKEQKLEITYINKDGLQSTEVLKRHKVFTIDKYLKFKLHNFNSIDNKTLDAEFVLDYSLQSEMYDGIKKENYDDMDNDNLFKIAKEVFYKKNEETGEEWYSTCGYTDEEINRMQLFSPAWSVDLLNLSFKSDTTSSIETEIQVYEEAIGNEMDSVDIISNFKGLLKIRNNFDLKTFPFDKQKIVFSFAEVTDTDVSIVPMSSVYANLNDLLEKENLINGWKLIDYRVQGFNYQESMFYLDKYLNGLNIVLEIERQSDYYVFKIIFPIILILMICWSAIWISPKEIESRLTVTIVCLLSLIAYNFVIDSELPKLEYLTIMDWIILTSYIFAAIPNFLCVISFKLYSRNKQLCMAIENKSKYLGPLLYLLIVLSIILVNVNLQPDNSSDLIKAIAGR